MIKEQYQELDPIDYLNDYNDIIVRAPSKNNYDQLPYSDLTSGRFERLCLKYCYKIYGTDQCSLYGYPGQKQHGLDVLVRLDDDKYRLFQCKRVESFTGSDLTKAINVFESEKSKEKWYSQTVEFVLFSSNELIDTSFVETFEVERRKLEKKGIILRKMGAIEISESLKDDVNIVYEFFGENWVRGFIKREVYDPFFAKLVPLPEKKNYPEVRDYIPRNLTDPEKIENGYAYTPSQPLTAYITECHASDKPVRVIIRSDAGLGKSKELEYLGFHYSAAGKIYPVIIRLKMYQGDLEKLVTAFYDQWLNIPRKRLLLLFDGLDEVPNGYIDDFIQKFNLFLQTYSAVNIVATARNSFSAKSIGDGVDPGSDLKPQYLKPLDENDIEKYLMDRGLSQVKIIKFKTLCESRRLTDLLKNPFYLKNLTDIDEHPTLTFPKDRGDAIAKIITLKLEEDAVKYPFIEQTSDILVFARRLAVYLTLSGRNSLSRIEINKLTEMKPDNLRYCSIFTLNGEGNETVIYFEHNNFQEYLAADFLKGLDWTKLKTMLFHEPAYDILKPRLVNTTNYLFTLLKEDNANYQHFFKALKEHNPELLLKFEKDKIQIQTRLAIFRQIILDGKKEGLYYLRGSYEVTDLLEFIDHSHDILSFLFAELNDGESAAMHKKCLLEIFFTFRTENITSNNRTTLHRLLKQIVQTEQQPAVHDMAIDAMTKHLFVTDADINLCIRKCIHINTQVVRAAVFKMISTARAEHYFGYLLKSASLLFPRESSSISQLGSDYLETILAFLNKERATDWLEFAAANFDLVAGIIDNMYDPMERLTIQKIYSKTAELYKETQDRRIFNAYKSFVSAIDNNISENKWGNMALFFKETNTSEEAFFDLLKGEVVFFYRSDTGVALVDKAIIDKLIKKVSQGEVKIDLAILTRNALHYFHYEELFQYLHEKLLTQFPEHFPPAEPSLNWTEINEQRSKRDFELLKGKTVFLDEAKRIFDEAGRIRDIGEDWFALQYSEKAEIKQIVTNNIIFHIIEVNKLGGYENFKQWIDEWNWDWYVFIQLTTYLVDQKKQIPQDSLEWLQHYIFNVLLKKVNFKKSLVKQENGHYAAMNGARLIRALYLNNHVKLSSSILLDMLSFDTSGFVELKPSVSAKEHLFQKIYADIDDKESFKRRVLFNLMNAFPESRVLETHCSICLTFHYPEAIPLLVSHLQKKSTESDVKSSIVATLIELGTEPAILALELKRVKAVIEEWQWDLFKAIYQQTLKGVTIWTKEECLKLAERSIKKHDSDNRIKWRLIKASIKLGSLRAADNLLGHLSSKLHWGDYSDIDALDFEAIKNYQPKIMLKKCFAILEKVFLNNTIERHNSPERFLTQLIRQLSIKNYKLMLFSLGCYEKMIRNLIAERPEMVYVRWYKKDLINDYYIKTSTFEDEQEVLEIARQIV